MGDSMETDLLPDLSSETWVAAVPLDEATGDLPPPDSDPYLIAASLINKTLMIVWDWVQAGAPPAWPDCAGLSPELRSIMASPVLGGRLLDHVYWPDVFSYLASCSVCLACKSLCPRRAPMGHVSVGHW